MKFNESLDNPKIIDIDIEDDNGDCVGNVSGIIHYSKLYLENWINSEKINENLREKLLSLEFPIAILKNINIYEDYKNNGYGNIGMKLFIDEAHEAKFIILIADTSESNNFKLE